MALMNELEENGCKNLKATMDRFLDDEDFYIDILKSMLQDDGFCFLGKNLEAENASLGFETSHMLKGIIGNCGITPMYESIFKIVEILRQGKLLGTIDEYQNLMNIRNKFIEIVSKH